MSVEPLAHARARSAAPLLAQHLIACPGCGKPAAVHLDTALGLPVVVRVVCPERCSVTDAEVLAALPAPALPAPSVGAEASLTA